MIRLLVAAVMMVGCVAALVSWWAAPSSSRSGRVRPIDEGSPYANTRPGVRYVGDSACLRCHEEIGQTYSRHPMGRSLSPIASATVTGGDDAGGRPLFRARGLEYAIERRDGRVFHQETRRDSAGRVVARNEAEVRFILGSGSQAINYLFERDGFLFQSPITWYVRTKRWDLAPGYQRMNVHFDRPVASSCLYCHANQVDAVAGTINRYRPPIFHGHAIGCERCHGPGELHVERPLVIDGRDPTIVNPADLEPSLRDAVCEQCHLAGHRRVVKRDRREEDYRPGLSFDQFWSVFERSGGLAEDRFVGQVEQMDESRCFRASAGRLGCTSCHDPHRLLEAEEKVAYYRERCLECHADRGCALPSSIRLGKNRDDDCVGCHMPRLDSSDILHVATTNHRIPRRVDGGERPPIGPADPRPGGGPLVLFHGERMNPQLRAEAERDLGVALCRDGPKAAAVALRLLEASLATWADDLTAWEAKGFALAQLRRYDEGLAAFRTVLEREPARESALIGAADLAARAGRRDDAIADLRRAIAISPWRSAYYIDLASLCFRNRDWPPAAAACREAIRLSPTGLEPRRLLVRCYLRIGEPQAARRELQTLLAFDPPDREELIRWFSSLAEP
jgi:Tetratricopeptide repeat/Cytochrome c554 and c-prime